MLADAIDRNETIVLEINGDKPYNWIVEELDDSTDLFKNTHREKIRNQYTTTICYLSHPRESLLESNKKRFLTDIAACNATSCTARLGNFLLIDAYSETVRNIFKVYENLFKNSFFQRYNITVKFFLRVPTKETSISSNYTELDSFDKYKESFESLSVLVPPAPSSIIGSLSFRLPNRTTNGGRKKQKTKSKKQKTKNKKI